MAEQIRHAAELGNVHGLPVEIKDAGDAAHKASLVFGQGRTPALLLATAGDVLA
jgi:hypothetical protein